MFVAYDIALDLLEKVVGKYKLVEGLVGRMVYLAHVTNPFAVALVDKHDVLAYAKHGVHVVGIDDCGYVVFVGDVAQELVYDD